MVEYIEPEQALVVIERLGFSIRDEAAVVFSACPTIGQSVRS